MNLVGRRSAGPRLTGLAVGLWLGMCLGGGPPGLVRAEEPPATAPRSPALEAEPPEIPVPDLAGRPTHAVVRVPTGCTVVIRTDQGEETLRLIGVYVAPEGEEAASAAAFAARLLVGERVYALPEPGWPERDLQGRRWAYVYRAPDRLNVNVELIRQGYARVAAADVFAQQELYRAYERHARRAGKGVWAPRGGEERVVATRPATTRPALDAGPQRRTAGDNTLVYVTEHGTRYHTRDCRFVREKGAAITLREARERGLKPCSRCRPPG